MELHEDQVQGAEEIIGVDIGGKVGKGVDSVPLQDL